MTAPTWWRWPRNGANSTRSPSPSSVVRSFRSSSSGPRPWRVSETPGSAGSGPQQRLRVLAVVERSDEGDAAPLAVDPETRGRRMPACSGLGMTQRTLRVARPSCSRPEVAGVPGREDDRGDVIERGLRRRAVALRFSLVVLGPDRPPLVDDGDRRQLRRDRRLDADVAGAVEGGDVVDEDDVRPLLVEQQPGEAARAPALGLHEDRQRRKPLGDQPVDPLRRRDQHADRLDPVPPRAGAKLLEQGDVEAGDAPAQLAAPFGGDGPDGQQPLLQRLRRRRKPDRAHSWPDGSAVRPQTGQESPPGGPLPSQ